MTLTTEIIGSLAGLVTVILAGVALVKWLVKHYLAELKPNGGGSIKDRVNSVDTRVGNLEKRVDEIYSLLLVMNTGKRRKKK